MKKPCCSICGKKLVDGFCPECGWQQRYTEVLASHGAGTVPKKKVEKIIWSVICVLLILLPGVLRTYPAQLLVSSIRAQQVMTFIPESFYENASYPLSPEGAPVQMTLSEGNYIVGIDIAEGVYEVSVVGRIASIKLEDEVNQISFFSFLREDSESTSPYLQNLKLYDGAIIGIETGEIAFSSSNGQVEKLQTLAPNESGDPFLVEDGAVAGADFPEGTYDITVSAGEYGSVKVSHPDREEHALGFWGMMGTDKDELKIFRNVEFPKGTMIERSDVEITLVPSRRNSLTR